MTEAEWLVCDDPHVLYCFARSRADSSRFRWLAADWAGRVRHLLDADDVQWIDAFVAWVDGSSVHPAEAAPPPGLVPFDYQTRGVDWAQRCADAVRRDDPMCAAATAALSASEDFPSDTPTDFTHAHRSRAKSKRAAGLARADARRAAKPAYTKAVLCEFCGQFRCVAGNPFRPAAFDPAWRTSTAVALAASIYDSRAFHDLPVLADALEDAGCDSADVLGHLRGGGPHARGCWAVDLVLGRE